MKTLAERHRNSAFHIGPRERALLESASQYIESAGYEGALVRHVVCFLTHCGARLSQPAAALVTGRTDRTVREIKRRTNDVSSFPDGRPALMPAAARLRRVAGTRWGTRRHLDTTRLGERSRDRRASQERKPE